MKNILIFAIVSFVILLSDSTLQALEAGPFRVAGRVVSFDEKTVTLNTGDTLVEIPRTLIAAEQIRNNQDIHLILLPDDAKKLKKRPLSKARK